MSGTPLTLTLTSDIVQTCVGESEVVPTYGYNLEQSTEQEIVMSLEDIMGGKDSVTFDHCSMFIDFTNQCDSYPIPKKLRLC